MLIRIGEAPAIGWSRNMLYSGFNILHRSVIRRQIGFAARITRTLSRLLFAPIRRPNLNRYYAHDRSSWPRWKTVALLVLLALAIGWIGYFYAYGDSRWMSKLVILLIGASLLCFSIAEQSWPVASIDANRVAKHNFCWFSQRIMLDQIESVTGGGAVLTVTTSSGSTATLNLLQLSEADRDDLRRRMLERSKPPA